MSGIGEWWMIGIGEWWMSGGYVAAPAMGLFFLAVKF
jgi:hypothetical protein